MNFTGFFGTASDGTAIAFLLINRVCYSPLQLWRGLKKTSFYTPQKSVEYSGLHCFLRRFFLNRLPIPSEITPTHKDGINFTDYLSHF